MLSNIPENVVKYSAEFPQTFLKMSVLLKKMRTQVQYKILSCCFVFGVNQENYEAGGVYDSLV